VKYLPPIVPSKISPWPRSHQKTGAPGAESVFVALLQHEVSRGSLVAGLLAYRAIYFLLPLLITLAMYRVVEAMAKALRISKKPR